MRGSFHKSFKQAACKTRLKECQCFDKEMSALLPVAIVRNSGNRFRTEFPLKQTKKNAKRLWSRCLILKLTESFCKNQLRRRKLCLPAIPKSEIQERLVVASMPTFTDQRTRISKAAIWRKI